jgi:hypothetical protein
MKTVIMSSALALMIAPAAFADQKAVVDFNQDGIISEADFIGSKSRLDDASMYAAQPQVVTREIERTVVVPGTTSVDVVPLSTLAPSGDNYVNIGEYRGGTVGTLTTTPATTRTITETRQVVVAPAPADTIADVYPNPHGNVEASVTAGLINDRIYQPAPGADGVYTAAELGFMNDEYADNRLAAYDTNKDGTVTASEAIANLDPLIDPNVVAADNGLFGPKVLLSPDYRQIGK